jgi:hypothetical protein
MSDTADLEARIDDLESRLNELEQVIHDGNAGDDVTGMREFVARTEPDTHAERALAIAYYLDQYQGHKNFTRADLEEGYRTCREQKPANMSDVIGDLEDKGWAMDDGKDGQSKLRRLTADGLAAIEEGLDDGA